MVWAGSLLAALSIRDLPGDWGHSICGAWGCGPPLQALLAYHLAWLVVLAPPAAVLVHSALVPAHILRRSGALLCVVAVFFVAAVVIYQRVAWWPSASEWQRGFFWHRCGFVLATAIDIPVAQVLLLGLYLHSRRPVPNVKRLTDPTPVRQ
jgi:hypothetical protein